MDGRREHHRKSPGEVAAWVRSVQERPPPAPSPALTDDDSGIAGSSNASNAAPTCPFYQAGGAHSLFKFENLNSEIEIAHFAKWRLPLWMHF